VPGSIRTVDFDTVIADFGPKIGVRILKKYGGMRICSPSVQFHAVRDRNIWHDYREKGMEKYELCMKYRLKMKHLKGILTKMRKRYRLEQQTVVPPKEV
jgi:Mor family transcriptional regulator